MMLHIRSGSRIFGLSRLFRRLAGVFCAEFCLLLSTPVVSLSAQEFPWPISAEQYITSSFGEPRPGRFHFGVDFSSDQITGKPVYALGDGSITRVETSPFGYGKLLEFTLDDGRRAVYAHLGSYLPAIEDSLASLRTRRHSYEVSLELPSGLFPARKGEIICWSGETGAGPPHLHVELRDASGNPLNLLSRGLAVRDTIPPEIGEIALIPLDRDSAANGSPLPVRYDPASEEPVYLTGRIGIAAFLEDRSGPAHNSLGIYRAELALDSSPVFSKCYDGIPLDKIRSGALDYLSEERFGFHRPLSALFRREGNPLDFYRGEGVLAIPPAASPTPHTLRITAADYAGNISTLDIPVIFGPRPPFIVTAPVSIGTPHIRRPVSRQSSPVKPGVGILLLHDCAVATVLAPSDPVLPPRAAFSLNGGPETPVALVPAGKYSWVAGIPLPDTGPVSLRVIARTRDDALREVSDVATADFHRVSPADSIEIYAPDSRFSIQLAPDALYRAATVAVDTVTVSPPPGLIPVTGCYRVSWGDEPLKGSCRAVFRLPSEPSPHALLFVSGNGRSWRCPGGQKQGRLFSGTCTGSGILGIFIDNRDPVLQVLAPRPGSKKVIARPELRVRVSDQGSGIGRADAINLFIDGCPVYGEYNPEHGEVRYQVREDLSPGVHHAIAAAMDRAGNRAVRSWDFRVK